MQRTFNHAQLPPRKTCANAAATVCARVGACTLRHVHILQSTNSNTGTNSGCFVNKAASVFKALFTTDAEDITCGQKRHTRNSVKLNYLSGCNERTLQVGLRRTFTQSPQWWTMQGVVHHGGRRHPLHAS